MTRQHRTRDKAAIVPYFATIDDSNPSRLLKEDSQRPLMPLTARIRLARMNFSFMPRLAKRLAVIVVCSHFLSGCNRAGTSQTAGNSTTRLPALAALGAEPGGALVAQGQLEPASGILPIVAPPGDRVESIDVTEGQAVKEGASLGRLASQAIRELELQIAMARRDEAVAKVNAEEAAAVAKLEVAKVGLRQAKLAVEQAAKTLEDAESTGGNLALLEQQLAIAEAKLTQLRTAASDRDTGRLVTQTTIEQQQLAVDQSRSQLNLARREAQDKIAEGTLAVEAAEKEIRASELAIASAKAASGVQTMDKQIQLLELQLKSIKLTSPINATVLSIDIRPGEPTSALPILRIADTSKMVAKAEVNVADLPRISIGANATITSSAFDNPMRGKVVSISRLVGSPSLPNANPMARVDWRSAEVVIEIDPEFVAQAAQRIQMQVDVAIEAVQMSSDPSKPNSGSSAGKTNGK
jgi:HlyD family secretion protein